MGVGHVEAMASPAPWNPTLYDDRAAFVSELASDLVVWLRPSAGEHILEPSDCNFDLSHV